MRVAHCVAILSRFMNMRILLESINGKSQRADCLCTMHAVGISMVWTTSTVCVVCVVCVVCGMVDALRI